MAFYTPYREQSSSWLVEAFVVLRINENQTMQPHHHTSLQVEYMLRNFPEL